MEFPDLRSARAHLRVTTRVLTVALDNTWGAGIAFNAVSSWARVSAVDVSMQALTKYPSGGGDVLMGSVTTRSTKTLRPEV